MSEQHYAYVARKRCGCVTTLVVDDPNHPYVARTEVSKAMRLGEVIDRMTVEDARLLKFHWDCKCTGSRCLCEPAETEPVTVEA